MTETYDEIKRGVERFATESLEPFDCVKCGAAFTPAVGQWIFYNLCDDCFEGYNSAKMKSRLSKAKDMPLSEYLGEEDD